MCTSPLLIKHPRLKSASFQRAVTDIQTSRKDGVDLCHAYSQTYIEDTMLVRCGDCYECRRARASEWRTRLLHENDVHSNCIFVTLTIAPEYYEEALKHPSTLLRKMFFKYRYHFRDEYTQTYAKVPKHWFITELGEEKGRLHFHGFIWDSKLFTPSDPVDLLHPRISKGKKTYINRLSTQLLRKIWPFGFADVAYEFSPKLISYATKYVLNAKKKTHDPRFKGRIYCSPGIGRDYALKHYTELRDALLSGTLPKIQAGRYRTSVPRYYTNIVLSEKERITLSDIYSALSITNPQARIFYVDGKEFRGVADYLEYINKIKRNSAVLLSDLAEYTRQSPYPRKPRVLSVNPEKVKVYKDVIIDAEHVFSIKEFDHLNTHRHIWHLSGT